MPTMAAEIRFRELVEAQSTLSLSLFLITARKYFSRLIFLSAFATEL